MNKKKQMKRTVRHTIEKKYIYQDDEEQGDKKE